MSAELKALLKSAEDSIETVRRKSDLPAMRRRIEEIDARRAEDGFWNDSVKARSLMHERQWMEKRIADCKKLASEHDFFREVLEPSGDGGEFHDIPVDDEAIHAELTDSLTALVDMAERVETETLFDGPSDARNALIEIQAGAGGDESCDWATMLSRMYGRWAEANGFKRSLESWFPGGQGDGTKSATWRIEGERAFGWLRTESGVHRLVRISPFDSKKSRHTSFCSVSVIPVADDAEIEIDIPKSDVRTDTFRAQGPGGQHRNKTDSAVRLTHLPTGITATSTEKSQKQNKDIAMKTLRSRLHAREMEKRDEEAARIREERGDAGWGNQIRSYVLHPYKMVKDHRTDHETSSADAVIDGDLNGFMKAALASGGHASR